MSKIQTFLILGPPGAGKGTQGNILGDIPGFYHLACGDVFRSLDTSTELGRVFLEYSAKGELVPDEPTIQLWHQYIRAEVNARRFRPEVDHLVLDGIPRNAHQAELMRDMIDVKAIFHVTCPNREELVGRMARRALHQNRIDDASEQVIRHRIATYEREAADLIACYPPDLVVEVDGTQHPSRVLASILGRINQIVAP